MTQKSQQSRKGRRPGILSRILRNRKRSGAAIQSNQSKSSRSRKKLHRRLSKLGGTLLSPFKLLGMLPKLLSSALKALGKAWKRREVKNLLMGIPAIGAVGLAGYLMLAGQLVRTAELIDDYTVAARKAMFDEKHEQARVYCDRLIKLGVEDNRTLYMMARASAEIGDDDRVVAVLDTIAPNDRPVYADAHFWKAERLSAAAATSRPRVAEIELHLHHALELEPNHVQAHLGLARLYQIAGRSDLAIEHYEAIVDQQPLVSLDLGRAYLLTGNRQRAISYGERARELCSQRSLEAPMSLTKRLAWAECELFLTRFNEAIQVLEGGLAVHRGDQAASEQLRRALSLAYIEYSDWLRINRDDSEADQLKLLEEALITYPHERLLFERFMRILKSDNWEETEQRLQRHLSRGESTAFVHLLLGTGAGERGQHDQAVFHLKQAYQQRPEMIIILNNLAWYMTVAAEPDLEVALKLSQLALSQAPEVHAFRDTRGQILAKMGRWEEALPDLEYALEVLKESPSLHASLAEVYSALGQSGLARFHRQRVQELEPKNPHDAP